MRLARLIIITYTRKNAQVVRNLQQTCNDAVPTTCQQDVFALLVPSLLRQACSNLLTSLLQACSVNNLLTSCEIFTCVVWRVLPGALEPWRYWGHPPAPRHPCKRLPFLHELGKYLPNINKFCDWLFKKTTFIGVYDLFF